MPALALLALLALLTLLSLLTLLCRPCCPCWPCWPVASIFLAQLLGIAPQHLLLPALLELCCWRCSAAAPVAAGGARARPAFAVPRRSPFAAARPKTACWPGLVLILLGIQFQVEQARQIAAGAAAAAASAALVPERNLNVAERRFGAQQVLQGSLFRRNRVLPALAFSLIAAGSISSAAASRSFANSGIPDWPRPSSRLRARVPSDLRLLLQLALDFGEETRVVARLVLVLLPVRSSIPGRRDDLLLPLGNLSLVATGSRAASPRRPAAAIAYNSRSNGSVSMNIMSVCEVTRASLAVRVHADHVARRQLVIFERDQLSGAWRLDALRLGAAKQLSPEPPFTE